MSTVCKHRHRGDKGGRAWCEPPHPHPRIGGRGRHRKLPALANNSGRTRTPRWWRVDLHDRRRRVEPPAHRLLPERVREGAAGVCTQLWRGECGGNSTPAAPLAYLKLRAGPGAPRGSWHGYNATRTRREETDSYVDVSDSKQYSSSVKMWTTDLSQTPILHRGPHALHTSHVSSEPQQRRLDVPACPLNDT
ncbi:uncharacterized protein LOC142907050 isoform X4 [Petromyzon marinus]|uniref:uncharacterized protein LOC142907050 isoform X4 n=1 Tax=Petromyzon marinus TaxID=7757 RepID=UPI003F718BF1